MHKPQTIESIRMCVCFICGCVCFCLRLSVCVCEQHESLPHLERVSTLAKDGAVCQRAAHTHDGAWLVDVERRATVVVVIPAPSAETGHGRGGGLPMSCQAMCFG